MSKHTYPPPTKKTNTKTPVLQALLKIQYSDPPPDGFRIFRTPLSSQIHPLPLPHLTQNEERVEELF